MEARIKRTLTIAILVLGMCLPVAAQAKDMNGKFGLGLDASTGGVSGLGFRYFIGNLKLNLTLGVNAFIPSGAGSTRIGFYVAPAVVYEFVHATSTNLGIGLRANLGYQNKAARAGVGSAFEANIEIPLEVEYFFSRHFAMDFSVSVLFDIVPKNGRVLNNKGASDESVPAVKGFSISFGAGSLVAGAGFTYYF